MILDPKTLMVGQVGPGEVGISKGSLLDARSEFVSMSSPQFEGRTLGSCADGACEHDRDAVPRSVPLPRLPIWMIV